MVVCPEGVSLQRFSRPGGIVFCDRTVLRRSILFGRLGRFPSGSADQDRGRNDDDHGGPAAVLFAQRSVPLRILRASPRTDRSP
jgi:hypothetical protein